MANQNGSQIFIQSKEKVMVQSGQPIRLKDLVDIYAATDIKAQVGYLTVKLKGGHDRSAILITMLDIVEIIKEQYPDYLVSVLGEPDIILSFQDMSQEKQKDKTLFWRLALVTGFLFIGSAMAIINFHSDINMELAHQTIYQILTGREADSLLWIQIPYSLGLGAGMSIFFNHVFKKKINQEPTPLEVEMYLYQQNIDTYVKGNNTAVNLKGKNQNG